MALSWERDQAQDRRSAVRLTKLLRTRPDKIDMVRDNAASPIYRSTYPQASRTTSQAMQASNREL